MLSNSNIKKLEESAAQKCASVAEVVPIAEDMGDQEPMALVSQRLKDAIKATDRVSRKIKKTVKEVEAC